MIHLRMPQCVDATAVGGDQAPAAAAAGAASGARQLADGSCFARQSCQGEVGEAGEHASARPLEEESNLPVIGLPMRLG